ncbi:MAG: N-acetylmuramoyl-L-alanine amidase [Gammaproteobacteria bacterium SG8_31]|jgi:N-acetylmuramoyl-L-alanine amidase|nr:MAG: N-acetylmuramoyl-L-alanine amidase [Gammaproteobacteria bacterium SG8_31]
MRIKITGFWLLFWLSGLCLAQSSEVQGIRVWSAPDNTRVVLDLSGPVSHSLFSLSNPRRVVIDLIDTRMGDSAAAAGAAAGLVQRIRSGARNKRDLRMVLDLSKEVTPRSFLLAPNAQYGHRLVVDLIEGSDAGSKKPVKTAPRAGTAGKTRELLIAIDAGHGGEDSGARGSRGTREKDVVLQIARRLEALVRREPGMRPVMIREGDYFIPLRKRVRQAREHKADLFVSIHADAFRDRRARGSSVYVLSSRGASSEMARILARNENAADLVGGVSLNDKDDLLKSVLLDLSQAASIEASMEVANNVLGQLRRLGKIHKGGVQQAGFVVLKSPDIPSILVETAFISNPDEERQLRDPRHQQKLAEGILMGIKAYFRNNPPPGTLMAQRQHVIKRGDTLSEIAQKYEVSMKDLQVANDLTDNTLQVGKVLRIPSEGS